MTLSRLERLILSNQYRILATLIPDEADWFEESQEILDCGYELHYDDIFRGVYEDSFSLEECNEVVDVLSMFQALKFATEKLTDKSGLDQWALKFHGFDGNEETKQMAYAEFFCGHGGGRFESLEIKEFNSHAPMLDRYRNMLSEWRQCKKKHELTTDDVAKITAASHR